MEIARMFHGWPWELLAIPLSEYRRLRDYYYAVREQENASRESLTQGGLDV